jgi:hypothetical protein
MKQSVSTGLGLVIIGLSLMGMSNGRANRHAGAAAAAAPAEPTVTPIPTPTPVPTPTPTPIPTPCPTAITPDAINQWRNDVTTAMGNTLGNSAINAWIQSCFPAPAQVPFCVNRLDKYLNRRNGQSNQDIDLTTDPHRRIPDELLVSGSDTFQYVFRGDIEEQAKTLGWPVARYKSRHSGGFDSGTPSLLMIEVPGSKMNPPVNFDRFINISLVKDDNEDGTNPTPQKHFPDAATLAADGGSYGGTYPHVLTMVTVEHGTRDAKARLYFQMFNRNGGVYSPAAPNNPSGCVSCHPSGLRAISPLGYHVRAGETQLQPDNWFQVKQIDSDMTAGQRGGISWGSKTSDSGVVTPTLDTKYFGPVVGPSEPLSQGTRTKEFIVGTDGVSGCQNSRGTVSVTDIFGRAPGRNNVYTFTSTPPVDWQKVSDAMDCEMCHNNERQGVLNELTSSAQIDFKILVDQSMPFGVHKNPLDQGTDPAAPVVDDLNLNERIALANCLQAEWGMERTKLREWLKQDSCSQSSAKNVKHHGMYARLPAAEDAAAAAAKKADSAKKKKSKKSSKK